ncbi:hypothetical protein NAPIS_ORF00954 [Vairimorpha apis BRL 01]|uniref:Kinetochore protein Spc24 n=1 Tax=Vairimorpha apis BRL 01 TaxID=1037528 RepID=T0LB19_9MICR|nr:hypothetical protein NAPIS_ORF00954 [Vairimorpha apis BRL 01]
MTSSSSLDKSDIHELLSTITLNDSLFNINLFTSITNAHRKFKQESDIELKQKTNVNDILDKKLYLIENEINTIKINHTKNNENINLVELENSYSMYKDELDTIQKNINTYDEQLRLVNKPTFNQLYLELIKGFGFDIKNGKCKIKNEKKKCVIEVDLNKNQPLYKTVNEIWENV